MATHLDTSHRTRSFASRPARRSAEVVVVGAGLGGLNAARELQRAGVSCLVLDARDRLGGCLGSGAWIDDLHHPRAWNLVRSLGVDAVEEKLKAGKSVVQGAGGYEHGSVPNFSEDDRRSYTRVRDNLESLSQRVDINNPTHWLPNFGSMSVHELVVSQGATPVVRKLADGWTAGIFGLDAGDVPALCFLLVCKTAGGFLNAIGQPARAGRRLRFRAGGPALCDALAERLAPGSVILSQAVRWIDQTPSNKIVLTTLAGEVFQCSRVVLAIPTASYRNTEFSPALGEHKQWMQEFEQPGFYTEVVLAYEKPWWREQGLNGFAQSVDGPVWETRDSSCYADGIYSLTCIVASDAGHHLWDMSEDERDETLIAHISDLFSDYNPFPNPTNITWSDFEPDNWVRHVPCPALPTCYLRNLEQDQWAIDNKLHFVGSETSRIWRGHIEGALASGSRGAEEVLGALRPAADELTIPRL
ncbi:hypothetical protein B0J13DRAFT_521780 [Dactylonectria estremocensis]|uniref:Amine oxidase n=1 Tax=Dactylonectria estremocensis TaxID=1079267 RepID=A0A9P9F974_9HYPO|nr:hypothetical protein B0J13DRAFT_521780 [Dactylonectria estremocensis]